MFTSKKDSEIEKAVGKTICAFANSYEGGSLLIGVDRHGEITGIERDYQLTRNRDGFELWLSGFVRDNIDPVLATKLAVSFVQFEGKTVCRVDVPPVTAPVFFAEDKSKRFYVRVQNQTNEYSGHDLLNYRKERWPESS
jgi:predicted HTH transcriptional regulator